MIGLIATYWVSKHVRKDYRPSHGIQRARAAIALLIAVNVWLYAQYLFNWTVSREDTLVSLLLSSAYSLLFVMVIDTFRSSSQLNLLLATILLSGTLQAFYGCIMVLSGLELGFFTSKDHMLGVATGTFVNRNHLAGYLELSLACGIGLLFNTPAERKKSLLYSLLGNQKASIRIALTICVAGLVMTHSRSGNIAFFSSLLIVGALFTLAHEQNRARNILLLTSIIFIDILIISRFFGLEALQQRISVAEPFGIATENPQSRAGITQTLLEQAPAYAGTGSGAGTFHAISGELLKHPEGKFYQHAHNDYMQFFIELGAPGFIALVIFIALAIRNSAAALFNKRSERMNAIGLAGSLGLSTIAIHSFTDFNLQIPANAATFIAICSLGYCLALRRGKNSNKISGS